MKAQWVEGKVGCTFDNLCDEANVDPKTNVNTCKRCGNRHESLLCESCRLRKVKATELPSRLYTRRVKGVAQIGESLYARRVKGLAQTGENGECSGSHKAGLSTKDKTSVALANGDLLFTLIDPATVTGRTLSVESRFTIPPLSLSSQKATTSADINVLLGRSRSL